MEEGGLEERDRRRCFCISVACCFRAVAHASVGCWALPGPIWRVEVGRRWTAGFSILSVLVGWRSGPIPRVAELGGACSRAGVWLGNCCPWHEGRTYWVKLDTALARFGSSHWGEGYLGTLAGAPKRPPSTPALGRAALASPRSSTTDGRYLPSGGRMLEEVGTGWVVLWRPHVRSFGRAMVCVCECVPTFEVSAILCSPRSSWLNSELLPIRARMRAQCCVTVSHLSSWSHIARTTAHPHVQADPSSWVAVSPRQHSRLRAACPGARCTHRTAQDITSHHRSALQYAHAPQIAFPDVSPSPRLGCCGLQRQAVTKTTETGSAVVD